MNRSRDYRAEITEIIIELLALEKPAIEQFEANGQLDEFTAADSMFLVELVLMLEDGFGIRFEPEHLDAKLLCNLDWLATFVAESTAIE